MVQRQLGLRPQVCHARSINFQPHGTPDASCHQHRPPVPAPMILCLTHSQACHVAIRANPLMLRVLGLQLPRLQQRTVEVNVECMWALDFQSCGHVNPVR